MIPLLAVLLALPFSILQTNRSPYGLPFGATIIERRTIPDSTRQNRAIIVWLLRPQKHPLEYGPEEYTCPDETRGSYFSGPTRVSLVDTESKRVINTVNIKDPHFEEDSFDVPYNIKQGLYYEVEGVGSGREGKPTIIALKDYNGDGRALEFAMFDAPACMGLQTTLIAYSERQDRLVQYPIVLSVKTGKRRSSEVTYWIDYLFSKQPKAPGYWKFEIDYRGRGGTLDRYEIHYNAQRERFEGTLDSKP